MSFLPVNGKCPEDSQIELVTNKNEKECCKYSHICKCKPCLNGKDMNKWCKTTDNVNFKLQLIEKGENIPGKCCDIFICRKIFLYVAFFLFSF